jgi:hypothetical protein
MLASFRKPVPLPAARCRKIRLTSEMDASNCITDRMKDTVCSFRPQSGPCRCARPRNLSDQRQRRATLDRRFAAVLADANARLGADVDRYSFIVVDLHHLLLAGLPAHFDLTCQPGSPVFLT